MTRVWFLCVGVSAALLSTGRPAAAQTFNVPTGSTQTQSGVLTDGATATTVWVVGGGTFVLNNTANTYTGGTNVLGNSTVQVDSDVELGGGTYINLGNSDGSSAGTLSFTNTTTAAPLSSGRYIVLQGAGPNGGGTILVNSNGMATLSGQISGIGALTVGGGGTLSLTGYNIYTGQTTISSGTTLAINGDTALGGYTQTTTTASNGVVTAVNTLTTNNALNINGGTLQFTATSTIARSVAIAGGSIDTNGNNAVFTQGITGSGGLTKLGTGVLVLNGANSYSGGTVVGNGTLEVGDSLTPSASLSSSGIVTVNNGGSLAGAGTVLGAVTNGGIVAPGAGTIGTLTVGSYTQNPSGILAAQVGPTGSSLLKVNGPASLGGTLNLSYGTGFLHPGTYPLLSATSITGGFSTVTGTVPSVTMAQSFLDTPTGISLVLTHLSVLPDPPTVLPALTIAAVDEAQQATTTLLSRLKDARTMGMVDGVNAALSPTHRVRGGYSPYGAWVQPTGNLSSVNGNAGLPGFDSSGYGLLTGIDAEVAPGFAAGFAIGYSRTSLNETGGASGTLDVPRVAFYGDWWHGPLAIDALIGVGFPNIDADRPIAAVGQTAKSSHAASELSGALQASLAYMLGDWAVSPAAGAKYVTLSQTGFTEHGTDLYNLTVASSHAGSLRPFVDATLSRRFLVGDVTSVVPQLRVGYENELLNAARSINVQTQGDITNWVIDGVEPSHGSVSVKAGLTIETDKEQSFFVDYDRIQSSSSKSDAFTAGFRYRM